ncbi:hypothetical protein D9M69_642080 [compost metagenome]
MLGHVRYVLHRDQMRLRFFDQPAEGIKQRPFAVVTGVLALVVGGERLARGATGEQPVAARAIPGL